MTLQKEKLIVIPMCTGLILVLCSWYVSYPLSIDSTSDFVFNHISPLYWFGLPLLLASLYIMAASVKNNYLKWIMVLGIVMSMYSLRYFYYSLPGSDIHEYRGITEYAIKTGDLDPSKPHHMYFQWPLFFILSQIAHSVIGLELIHFEFILFAILGFLYVTSLYIYASKFFKKSAYLVVIGYFIIANWVEESYMFSPFTLAFALLCILFMLEAHTSGKRETTLATMIIFTSITFIHPFMPTFYIIYTFIMYILTRNKKYERLLMFTLSAYLVVTTYFAVSFIPYATQELSELYLREYTGLFGSLLSKSVAIKPFIGTLAEIVSHTVTLLAAAISGLGFLFLLTKRKQRQVDSAIFLSGVLYALVGGILFIVGRRGFLLIFIATSLGVAYFLNAHARIKSKVRIYVMGFFLILIILFTFNPLNSSFYDSQIKFQTAEEYQCANFVIDYCVLTRAHDWTQRNSILSHFRLSKYLQMRSGSDVFFGNDFDIENIYSSNFPENVRNYDCVVFTVGLGKSFLSHNSSMEKILYESKYNIIFNSGFSYIAIKANTSRIDR